MHRHRPPAGFFGSGHDGQQRGSRVKRRRGGGFVYSSEEGRLCPSCCRPVAECVCVGERRRRRPSTGGTVRVSRQTKGRKGKGVTVVSGLPLSDAELAELGADLKRRCGSGGTVKAGVIEIQGDHRDVVVAELAARGWRAKRAGG